MSATTGRYAADVDRENAELHRLRAERLLLLDVAAAARAMLDLNPEIGRGQHRLVGWFTLMNALDKLDMGSRAALGEAQR